jgi:aminopeptidase
VDRISLQVMEIAGARPLSCAPDAGRHRPHRRDEPGLQVAQDQRHHQPNKWGNLPGGETFTTPGEVNGTFVIDGVVGDYLCAKYGDLRERR